MATTPRLCLTCSSTLSADYDAALPSSSEKPYHPPIAHPCGHEVCGTCLSKNRRLAKGCILCESVLGAEAAPMKKVGSGSRPAAVARSGSELPAYRPSDQSRRGTGEQEEGGDFVLGDDSDEEDDSDLKDEDDDVLPPSVELDAELPPAYAPEGSSGSTTPPKADEKREQNSIHYIRPEETLLGLSMKYNVDVRPPFPNLTRTPLTSSSTLGDHQNHQGRLLCALNRLPPSTLSTTPSLLHTLPFLLLPPNSHSLSNTPLLSPLEEHRRLILRRFQVHTRCAEWAMAKAYVQPIFDKRDQEAAFVRENRRARGDLAGEGGEEVKVREGGELEEALEAWERDQSWEREQMSGKGKGSGVVGSKIKSTGQVEARVKGWGWK